MTRFGTKTLLAIGGVVGAAIGAAMLGLIQQVAVPLILDAIQPPPEQRAAIKKIHFERGSTTRGRYLEGTGRSVAGIDRSRLDQPGLVVFAPLELVGLRGKQVEVRGRLFDADRNRSLDKLNPQIEGRSLVAETDDLGQEADIWIPKPRKRGRYVVAVEVWAQTRGARSRGPEETRLSAKDSPIFVVGRWPYLFLLPLGLARSATVVRGCLLAVAFLM